jgi:hypothetical protein
MNCKDCLVCGRGLQDVVYKICRFVFSLVDDRCVVQPDAGDLGNPPKKFRGNMFFSCGDFQLLNKDISLQSAAYKINDIDSCNEKNLHKQTA